MEKMIKGLAKSSTADREKKSKKRLQTFINEKNLTKKWKTLVKITEKETGEDLRRFFIEQCDNIITTINMFVGTLELAKDKTKKGQESDVMQVFDVLKKCIVLLVAQIKNRWKFQELLGLITKLLARQNKSSVRTGGFELLLLFAEALLQAEDTKEGIDDILDLFSRTINFQPLLQEYPTANLLAPPAADPALILVPSSGESIEEAIDQFHMFFEFMTARTGRSMEFWFEQFKARYLTVLYPRVMKEIGYEQLDERSGFSDKCPAQLQCALIEQLDKWKGNVPLTTRLWDERNAPLMFEIVRQVTLLPLKYAATVKRVLFTYRHWFLTKRIREEVQQSYWRLFIGHWVTLFSADPSDAPEEYRGLFIELLSLYNSLSQTNQQMLDEHSWHTLQHSILTGAEQLFTRLRALRARDPAVDTVAEDVVNHLFLVWIRSPYNSDEMWQKFHEVFVSLLDQSHVIRGWKEKIVRLTALLVEYYYTAELTSDTEDERPVKETVVKDTMGVTWDETKIKDMWFTILNICGNINNIAVPLNYETAMQCVAEMIDIFIASENKIPLNEHPHKMPLLDIFLPWLLQACYSATDKQQGLVIAYRVLAKLFCRQHALPLDIDLLAHFYRVVLNGLTSDREPVRDAVLISTRLIFSYDLPGSAVLISAYLHELQSLFTQRSAISSEVQRSATTLLHSLLSYPAHYSAASYPVPGSDQNWSASDLRERLTTLLHHLLNGNVSLDATTRQQVLWALCVHVFDELRADALAPRMDIVVRSLQLIIEHTRHRDDQVALTACEALGCMTTLIDEFTALNQDLTYSVIALLTDNIAQLLNELLAQPNTPRDKVINDNFATLSAWLVSQGNLYLTDPELNTKIFQLLELALLGQIGTEPNLRTDNETRASEEEEPEKKKRKDSTRKTLRASESTPRRSGTMPSLESVMERLVRQPVHGSSSVQQAAELFLATLTNYYNNFPTPAGATMMESFLEDEEDKTVEALFFSHYDRHVLALYPLNDLRVRFVVRTPLGKFAWDCTVDWGDEHVITQSRDTQPTLQPLASPSRDLSPPCPLSAHLAALYAEHPEAMESGAELGAAALGQPRMSGAYSAEIRAHRPLLDDQILQDISVQSRTSPRTLLPPMTEPFSESHSPVSLFSCSRVLMSALGMLSTAHRRELHQLEDSSRLRRALQDLDRVRGREVVKVGVIYVREGQERQLEILCNEEGSAEYHALLRGLGWPVEIQSHAGFKAGLAADGSNGTVTPYYANERYELVYHVVSYMPTKDSDPKQVTKKRHVGNDPVHIVWSEHKRDYDPNVIVSQFNDAHIVVYPLSSGLFRIQVFKKDKLKVIGPLQDGMIVTKRTLADLLRLTAVSAHRAVRYSQKGYEHPFTIRTRYIQEAVRRYKAPRAAEEFMHRLYPLKAEYLKSATTPVSTPAPASPRPAALSVPVMPVSSVVSPHKAPPSPHHVLNRSSSIGPNDTAPKFNPQVKRPPPPAVKRDSSLSSVPK